MLVLIQTVWDVDLYQAALYASPKDPSRYIVFYPNGTVVSLWAESIVRVVYLNSTEPESLDPAAAPEWTR